MRGGRAVSGPGRGQAHRPAVVCCREYSGGVKKSDIVIIGGGAAGSQIAQVLSRAGKTAVIVDPRDEPVELPPLTDGLFGDELTVTPLPVPPGTARITAEAVRVEQGAVHLADGRVLEAESIVIATGLSPRRSPIPGGYTVGSLPEAQALRAAVLGTESANPTPEASVEGGAPKPTGSLPRLGVLGSGFLALEIARSAADRGVEVSLHLRGDLPLPGTSPELGRAVLALNEAAGVRCVPHDPNPDVASADVWAAAVGSRPVLPECSWPLTFSGRLAVGADLQVVPGVWAVGDCAEPVEGPNAGLGDGGAEPTALSQGLWLGRVLAGEDVDARWHEVPSRWSFQGTTRVFTAGASYSACDPNPVALGDIRAGRGQLLFFSGPEDDSVVLRVETIGLPPAHNAAKRLLGPVLAEGLDAIAEGHQMPGAVTRKEAEAPDFDMRRRVRQPAGRIA